MKDTVQLGDGRIAKSGDVVVLTENISGIFVKGALGTLFVLGKDVSLTIFIETKRVNPSKMRLISSVN